jgi:plastocyanin
MSRVFIQTAIKRAVTFFLILIVLYSLFIATSYAETLEVRMEDSFFEPSEITVQVGDIVRWRHSGFLPHTTTSGTDPNNTDGLWDSGALFFAGQSFSVLFPVTGTFPYHCTFHGFAGMTGTVTVQPAAEPDTIPLPEDRLSQSYDPIEAPILSFDPFNALPVGVGPLATGGDLLRVQVGLEQFAGPVDMYGAFTVSTKPNSINVLNPDGNTFTPFTFADILNAVLTGTLPEGVQPWKAGVSEKTDETLFQIALSKIPPGTYTIYLLVTPEGDLGSFYLWRTFFVVL